MTVGDRGEAPTFLESAVEILLVGLAEYAQHGQREVHVLVVIQTYPRRPESMVLAVVGDAETMSEFLGGKTIVEYRADMRADFVPFLHVHIDHLAMVGIAKRDALASEIDTHMRLIPVILDQEFIACPPRRMVKRFNLIHQMMFLRYALKCAVKSRRHVISVDNTVDQVCDFSRHREALDIPQELIRRSTIHDRAAEFAAAHR